MPLPVLFQQHDLVAIDKPAGLAVIPGRAETDSVLESLATQLSLPCAGSADPRVRVIHRLDKGTSGVVLCALTAAAQRHVSRQFLEHTVAKEYLALVAGEPSSDEGSIEAPIGPHPTVKQRMIVTRHGRPAITRWRVEQRLERWTLLRVFPQSGKTHQIRVHLQSIGLPLAIDPLYNAPRRGASGALFLSQIKRRYRPVAGQQERPLIDRLTLHAERLSFTLPDGIRQTVQSLLPRDLRAAIMQLAKNTR